MGKEEILVFKPINALAKGEVESKKAESIKGGDNPFEATDGMEKPNFWVWM